VVSPAAVADREHCPDCGHPIATAAIQRSHPARRLQTQPSIAICQRNRHRQTQPSIAICQRNRHARDHPQSSQRRPGSPSFALSGHGHRHLRWPPTWHHPAGQINKKSPGRQWPGHRGARGSGGSNGRAVIEQPPQLSPLLRGATTLRDFGCHVGRLPYFFVIICGLSWQQRSGVSHRDVRLFMQLETCEQLLPC
jgi:hypothetical protein